MGESLSQDSEEERDLVVSFSESTPESSSASLIEMIENLEKIELQNEDFKSHRFCLENMTEDDSASFYTGFPNMETFQATLTYLDPGKHGENIVIGIHLNPSLMRIFESKVDEDIHQNTIRKRGRSRTLKPEDKFVGVGVICDKGSTSNFPKPVV